MTFSTSAYLSFSTWPQNGHITASPAALHRQTVGARRGRLKRIRNGRIVKDGLTRHLNSAARGSREGRDRGLVVSKGWSWCKDRRTGCGTKRQTVPGLLPLTSVVLLVLFYVPSEKVDTAHITKSYQIYYLAFGCWTTSWTFLRTIRISFFIDRSRGLYFHVFPSETAGFVHHPHKKHVSLKRWK